MPWLLTSPGHQQPWYWLYRICWSFSYLRKNFKYLCQINVVEWHKMQRYVYIPSDKFSTHRVKTLRPEQNDQNWHIETWTKWPTLTHWGWNKITAWICSWWFIWKVAGNGLITEEGDNPQQYQWPAGSVAVIVSYCSISYWWQLWPGSLSWSTTLDFLFVCLIVHPLTTLLILLTW